MTQRLAADFNDALALREKGITIRCWLMASDQIRRSVACPIPRSSTWQAS